VARTLWDAGFFWAAHVWAPEIMALGLTCGLPIYPHLGPIFSIFFSFACLLKPNSNPNSTRLDPINPDHHFFDINYLIGIKPEK
jgi:hypothetical protein